MARYDGLSKYLKEYGFLRLLGFVLWILYAKLVHFANYSKDSKKISSLKGKYREKRIFLIGNGPSLNKTPLYLLKDEYTICFNRFNIMLDRLDWLPSFYMLIDGLVGNDMVNEVEDMIGLTEKTFLPDILPKYKTNFRKYFKNNKNVYWLYPKATKDEDLNLPHIHLGGSVATAALRVLIYLGFSEIYLIGVDMNYKIHSNVKNITKNDIVSNTNDDPNHFDPRYFGTNRKYHQPTKDVVNNILSSFDEISRFAKTKNVKIFNATIGGKLESFERVKFNKLFDFTEEEMNKLLFDGIRNKTGVSLKSVYDIVKIKELSIYDIVNESTNLFIVAIDDVAYFVEKYVEKYIPFGPLKNKVIFIKRNKK